MEDEHNLDEGHHEDEGQQIDLEVVGSKINIPADFHAEGHNEHDHH